MKTASFEIPVIQVEFFKRAAADLEIDMTLEAIEPGKEWVQAHVLIHDITSLVGLAFCAGTEVGRPEMEKLHESANKMADALKTLLKIGGKP